MQKKSLVLHFSWVSAKTRYQSSYMGMVWTVLEPLMMFLILYLVFSSIRVTTDPNFPVYLLIGVLTFHMFTRGTQSGLASLRSNKGIINSINIRKEFFPVISAGSTGILMIIEVLVFLLLLPILNYELPLTLILLPLPLILLLLLILGISYYLSILFVYARDIQILWGVISYGIFFLTPIFWYVNEAGEFLQLVQKFNPLGQIVELAHKIVFNEIPSINDWTYTTLFVLIIFFSGYYFFQRYESKVSEEL